MTEFQSRENGSSQKERHGRISDGTGSHRKEKKASHEPCPFLYISSFHQQSREEICVFFAQYRAYSDSKTHQLSNRPTTRPLI
jgi:hypothetical protein